MKWNMRRIAEGWVMSKNLLVTRFEPPKDRLLMHSIEAHNYWIERGYACPYCTHGSKIVDKKIIDKRV